LAESGDRYEKLQKEYEAARLHRETLDEQARANAAPYVMAVAPTWFVETAQITGRRGGPAPVSQILTLGALSLSLGGFVSWLASTIGGLRTFPDIASVQQRLPIPVVAEIETSGGPLPNRFIRRAGVVRSVVVGCELVLACCVFACVVVAFAGVPSGPQLADDPFGVVTDVFLRAAQRHF
jgi:hypothetical protein